MYKEKYIKNQLILKSLNKYIGYQHYKININVNLFKLNNLNNNQIIYSLLLVEIFGGQKAFINNLKKNFKELNIQLMTTINKKNIFYTLNILRFFYLPILQRRNHKDDFKRLHLNNYVYKIINVNLLPFIPDIFFNWHKPLNINFTFKTKKKNEIKLLLCYVGIYLVIM